MHTNLSLGGSALIIILVLTILLVPPMRSRTAIIYAQSSTDLETLQSLGESAGWQHSAIETEAGITMPGLVRPASSAYAPWVLFVPGNGGGQLPSGQQYLQRLATGHPEWGLAVWPYRGSDRAPGIPSKAVLQQDLRSIYAELRRRFQLANEQLHLVGFSFGSDLSVMLAAELASENHSPASLTLLSTMGNPVLSWTMRATGWYRRWLPVDHYDLEPLLDDIKAPLLMVEGSMDLLGPADDFRRRLGVRNAYVEIPGGGHTASLDDETAVAAVRGWIVENQRDIIASPR